MSILGSSADWAALLDKLLPDLLRLIEETWNTLSGPLQNAREDTVTNALCRALRTNRTLRDMPFYIIPQMVELEPLHEEDEGRIDIAFLPSGIQGPPNESIYFCLECKWLNVTANKQKRPGGSEYVKYGMQRFVTGQYAKAVKHGGMVGYVQDGDIPGAIANIENNVQKHHKILNMTPPGVLETSSILSTPRTRESFHSRNGEDIAFRIHHIFVSADGLFADDESDHSSS